MIRPNRKDAYKLFHDGTVALAKMEGNGIRIDEKYLDGAIKRTQRKIQDTERRVKEDKFFRKWRRRFGLRTNFDSTQQLGTMLKGEGYKAELTTDKGNEKWDKVSLAKIDLPVLKDYITMKELKKALSTYLIGIRREVKNGFVHPSFNLAGGVIDDDKGGAGTYRGSCSMPNLQNVPIRNKMMQEIIRKMVIPREGMDGYEFDFGQIEVRVAACGFPDPALLKYCRDPTTDMHRDTAADLFFMSTDDVMKYARKTARDAAKNKFVFPEFYGNYYVECAKDIWEYMRVKGDEFVVDEKGTNIFDHLKSKGIHRLGACDPDHPPKQGTFEKHVQQVERIMWEERFPTYNQMRKELYWDYLRKGYVDMMTGFRCQGKYRRNQVINIPVQGPAFHCLLWSITEITSQLEKYKMKTVLTAQIHDCGIGDSPPKERQDFLDICRDVMTRKIRKHWDWIIVPLETEVDVFTREQTWYGKSPIKQNEKDVWIAS